MRSLSSYDYSSISRNAVRTVYLVVRQRLDYGLYCLRRAKCLTSAFRQEHFPFWGVAAVLGVALLIPLMLGLVVYFGFAKVLGPQWNPLEENGTELFRT
jgi:ACR3 family arsenite efflux pump ArsB